MRSLPPPFLLPLRIIPNAIHTFMLSKCCNHLLRGQLLASRLSEIDAKSLCIRVLDADCEFHFRISAGQLEAVHSGSADVTISGNSLDFWQLATQQEDADTLFFKRSLNIEGETETGVHIKNLLDSLEFDWDKHFDTVLFPPLSSIAKDLKNTALCLKNKYENRDSFKPNS